jgi:penicillin-binding protein A
MRRWSTWVGVGAAAGLILALVPVVRGSVGIGSPLNKLAITGGGPSLSAGSARAPERPEFRGLDLLHPTFYPERVTAPLAGGRDALLTLDPVVQREALAVMKRYGAPEAGVILMQVKTGNLIAYASYVPKDPSFDVNVHAEAPSASVFKVVTASALLEKAGLTPEAQECYHGGRSRIAAAELKDDAKHDKWCATMTQALARSLNVVFAKFAEKKLTPEIETAMGGAYGYGAPVPFAVPNQTPKIAIPAEPVEFARSAAGFYHTTLSPLLAVSIAQTVANGGVALEPRIVQAVYQGRKKIWEEATLPRVLRRAVKPGTASELARMMTQTVSDGTAYKAFHDRAGHPYLPGIEVAGKTGTLARHSTDKLYTWFVGFAPADKPEVAIAALVVNNPTWRIKAPELAREVLCAYYAKKGVPGVRAP